jgi:hypothetical protein
MAKTAVLMLASQHELKIDIIFLVVKGHDRHVTLFLRKFAPVVLLNFRLFE